MDARLQFEWIDDTAKNLVKILFDNGLLGTGNADMVDRDDAEYVVSLSVKLKHKRKSRSLKNHKMENE